jgi:SAM-dependent methyltransferase
MTHDYAPDAVRAYYDEYGEREWARFERRPMDRVNLEVHRRFLARLVKDGDRVLEVGAGPGRFTILLADLGARTTVVELSPRQLQLNRQRVTAAGCQSSIEAWELGDVVDLSRFGDGSFDVATAFGGPLSYLFGRAGEGLDQLLRTVRPDGFVAFSVMSRWGALRMALMDVFDFERRGLQDLNRQVIETGDLVGELARVPGMSLPHECHLFTWGEIEHLLDGRRCELVDASASNYLSVNLGDEVQNLDQAEWETFLDWEERACRSRGIYDAGTHILVAIRRI